MQPPSDPSGRDTGSDLVLDARCYVEVLKALEQRQVLAGPPDVTASPELDLVLVRGLALDAYVVTAADRFRDEVAALAGVPGAHGPDDRGAEPSGLDYLLYDLRRDFGERTGSVPVLGKNRDALIGYPQHKAIQFPSPPDAEFSVPAGSAGAGVLVGIVDTPPVHHPMVPPSLVDTDVWHEPAPVESPWAGHGTFVAGLVRHEAPGARLRMRAGLSPLQGHGSCWDVARAIAGFKGSGAAVLNLSFGCVTADGAPPLLLERALARLDSDVLVVVAAGNRGCPDEPGESDCADAPGYLWPGAMTSAVAVGATPAKLSEFSMRRDWVDVVADGVLVTSTFLDADVTDPETSATGHFDGFATWSGTSFAAATVTGKVAARMTQLGVGAREALNHLLSDHDSGVACYRGRR